MTIEASKLSLKDAEGRIERLVKKLKQKGCTSIGASIGWDGIELIAKKPPNLSKWKDNGKIRRKRAAEILDLSADDDDLEEMTLILQNRNPFARALFAF